ncbi:MAG: GNAT family N-acetyltransferase [Bacteroidia bacterium]|nr:GNAT family N-acetyltransferase [Bacteroidia bacterium]
MQVQTLDIKIEKADSEADIHSIAALASTIWNEYYVPFIGQPQIDYMLKTFQSFESIKQQITQGDCVYYTIQQNTNIIGYLAYKQAINELFLSKIYVVKEKRRIGIGKIALDFLTKQGRETKIKKITLTVNKDNSGSIAAYKRMGFVIDESIVTPIGLGFVMDDYKMSLDI